MGRSESESWVMCAGAHTSKSSRLSVNSSNHSGRSRKRSSESRLPSLFFLFWVWVFWEWSVPLSWSWSVTSLLSWTCWRQFLSCRRIAVRTGVLPWERQEVWSCPLCVQFSSPPRSTVSFDRWPTHRNICGLRRLFQAIEQQTFLRVIALSRRDWGRERIPVLPRLYALSHWL